MEGEISTDLSATPALAAPDVVVAFLLMAGLGLLAAVIRLARLRLREHEPSELSHYSIGTTDIEHVMATQTLWQEKPKTMRVDIDGRQHQRIVLADWYQAGEALEIDRDQQIRRIALV